MTDSAKVMVALVSRDIPESEPIVNDIYNLLDKLQLTLDNWTTKQNEENNKILEVFDDSRIPLDVRNIIKPIFKNASAP